MKATIEVRQIGEGEFCVGVMEGGSETSHRVTLKASDYKRITGLKIEPTELVKRTFEFLLAREPKESILAQFDLSIVGRYFGEFEREMKRSIAGK